jgi:hypothetical protein
MPGIFTEKEMPTRAERIKLGELIELSESIQKEFKLDSLEKGDGFQSICVTKLVRDSLIKSDGDMEELLVGLRFAVEIAPRFATEVVYQAATRIKKLPNRSIEIVDLKCRATLEEGGRCLTIMFPNEN